MGKKQLSERTTIFYNCAYYLCLVTLMGSCKKPYNPPVTAINNAHLVVEGIINSGGDSTIIKLSRTVPLQNKSTNAPVLSALVSVESSQGDIFALKEAAGGKYISPGLNINKDKSYRLHIKTSDNKEYASDYVPVQTTPPIDSVGFTITNTGLVIYANTHDPDNKVKYYRWDYDEEWEFHAALISKYIVNHHIARGGRVVSDFSDIATRDASNQVYFCYRGDVSSDVVLGSSASLQQAVIYQNPILSIPYTSEKVETEYSILLRQYALTKEAHNFYTQLKKNTEQLGSIFDALPSQSMGNIHSLINPAELVTGFISVNNIQSKRIFVRSSQLPFNWVAQYPYSCSEPDLIKNETRPDSTTTAQSLLYNYPHANVLIDTVGQVLHIASYECADCTIRGSRNPPSYWR